MSMNPVVEKTKGIPSEMKFFLHVAPSTKKEAWHLVGIGIWRWHILPLGVLF